MFLYLLLVYWGLAAQTMPYPVDFDRLIPDDLNYGLDWGAIGREARKQCSTLQTHDDFDQVASLRVLADHQLVVALNYSLAELHKMRRKADSAYTPRRNLEYTDPLHQELDEAWTEIFDWSDVLRGDASYQAGRLGVLESEHLKKPRGQERIKLLGECSIHLIYIVRHLSETDALLRRHEADINPILQILFDAYPRAGPQLALELPRRQPSQTDAWF